MAWSHITPNSINLTYIFLGLFTSIFIGLSGYIKNDMYLGEANVAFFAGIIFGPKAANLFDPTKWSNPDIVILECTRVVLVIQCFAVAVQLRTQYVQREWRSLAWMLLPVMIWGWVISSVGISVMDRSLSWKECMACAACFNAIDPILAATVINGKAADRVPKHLRDLLLAESACNDITTTLALELSTQVIQYANSPRTIAFRFCALTVGYEVLFGATAGLLIGFAAHYTVKAAVRNDVMDRPSFLAFYFVLGLFCTGVGALLGVDEVLLGFCAGYAFDIDDWFQDETEKSNVSNVIDLMLNLTFFVLLGSIIPWHSYKSASLAMVPWRLVLGTMIILLFRRLPIVMLLQRFIPATKTWQESLFVGHFGPIGGGAIFSALVIKVQLESGGSRGDISNASNSGPFHQLTASIWPIVTFVVLCSSIMHGTTVPAFLLGRQVTTRGFLVSLGSDNDSTSGLMAQFPKLAASASFRRTRSSSLSQSDRRSGFFSRTMEKPEAAVLARDRSPTAEAKPAADDEITRPAPKGKRVRAYHYGDKIVLEDEVSGQILTPGTVPDDDGPSKLYKVKKALQGKQLPKPPQLIVSEPGAALAVPSDRSTQRIGHHHQPTEAEFMRQMQELYPDRTVRAARLDEDDGKYAPAKPGADADFLQASPSAAFFQQQRRRSISFNDEARGEAQRAAQWVLKSGPSEVESPNGSTSGHLAVPVAAANLEKALWA